MAYTTINKSTDYFNTKLYTGTGSSNAITGVGFQPDLLWIKSRSNTYSHSWTDAVRGKDNKIASNNSNAQYTDSGQLASFDSDGFTLNTDAGVNNNNSTYASWNWKANGQGSANTDGSINTTYTSVNTTAGFSISKWTGNSTAGATIGHGLGVKPSLIIIKNLGASSQWLTWFDSFANTEMIYLNLTNAKGTGQTYFNSTTPTSSLITLGGGVDENQNTMVAYCFAEKKGFSKFGSYTGNGNTDGTFVYTGFKPAMIIFKIYYGGTGSWVIYDNKRNTFNVVNSALFPDLSNAEETADNGFECEVDMLSNGFKLRGTGNAYWMNYSGWNYIYMAFAEEPLVASNGVPATAR